MNTMTETDLSTSSAKRGAWLIGTTFGLYSIVVLTLAGSGFFASINTNFFPAVVALATIALTASYFLSPSVRTLAVKLGPYGLAYFHIWLLLPRSIKLITGFHIVGFADFVVAVGTGITLNAVAPESMANIVLLPIAIIPLVGVPLSGATHIAALHLLLSSQNDSDQVDLGYPMTTET